MNDDSIDSVFAEMTSGLDIDCGAAAEQPDAPFALTANGSISVNVDNQIRIILREAAQALRARLRAAEMTALPTPQVDGDPADDFGAFSAQTLTDLRIERLGALMASIASSEIDAETAHVWIGAANDLRLDARATVENATAAISNAPTDVEARVAVEDPGAVAMAALVHDLAGAVSHELIGALKG